MSVKSTTMVRCEGTTAGVQCEAALVLEGSIGQEQARKMVRSEGWFTRWTTPVKGNPKSEVAYDLCPDCDKAFLENRARKIEEQKQATLQAVKEKEAQAKLDRESAKAQAKTEVTPDPTPEVPELTEEQKLNEEASKDLPEPVESKKKGKKA